jgi:hypothetical protein
MEVEQFSTKRPTSKLPAAWEQRDTLEVCQGVGTRSAAFVAFLERYKHNKDKSRSLPKHAQLPQRDISIVGKAVGRSMLLGLLWGQEVIK